MAIVYCNSLAALYEIRQKFDICPTRNAFMILLNLSLKRKAIFFCSI